MKSEISIILHFCILTTFFVRTNGFNSYDSAQSEPVTVTIREEPEAEGSARNSHVVQSDWLHVTLRRQERDYSLVLERNRNVQTDVPVSVHRNGRLLHQRINDTEIVGFYHSFEPYGTFMTSTNKENISSTLKLTGHVKFQDDTYRLYFHDDRQEYRLSKLEETFYGRNDIIVKPDSDWIEPNISDYTEFVQEEERINKPLYEVEVLAVADFSEYEFWLDVVSQTYVTMPFIYRDMIAKEKLRQYIAFVLNGVDLRYRTITTRNYNIRVLFTGLYLADTKESSPWTEKNKRRQTNPVQVDSDIVLAAFTDWSEEFKEYLTVHDHAMLFTKYDITRNEIGSLNTDIVGVSTVGDICLANQQSLIEDRFGEDVALTAANELGHNLGAYDDGKIGFCLVEEGYIMSPEITHDKPLLRNHWKFSACSQYYFFKNINNLNRLGLNCMTTRGDNIDLLPEYSTMLPGQIYGPDEQCEYMFGRGSYLYRYGYMMDYTSICSTLKCVVPNMDSYYITDTMEGTSCGKGKLCHGGYCVEDARASTNIRDECPFGDSPEIDQGSWTKCSTILYKASWEAYLSCQINKYSCCVTCSNFYAPPHVPAVTTKRPTEAPGWRQPLTGECITSCEGVRNGEYQSCKGCHVYASCFGNVLHDERPCQLNLLWSDDLKRCEYSSNTC